MDQKEKKYLDEIEKVIEKFGAVQRNFVLDKTGIRAIIKFVEDLEGRRPFFELDDPVVQKGKLAAERVVNEIKEQNEFLKNLKPSKNWESFHRSLLRSLDKQLEGYMEMAQVFEDSDLSHVEDGQLLVNQGMKILEGGGLQ